MCTTERETAPKNSESEDYIMWHEGTIGIKDKDGKMVGIHYQVKVYDEGSQYGIEGGRISKLWLRQGKTTVANYDRGWDIKPQTPEAETALAILMHEYK